MLRSLVVISLLNVTNISMAAQITFCGASEMSPIDKQYKSNLEADGFTVNSIRFEQLAGSKAGILVIGMVPENFKVHTEYLTNYVSNGGKLVFIPGFCGYSDPNKIESEINAFLNKFGAGILWERITDTEHQYIQHWAVNYHFFSTKNIKGHKLTAGVGQVYYPGGKEYYDLATRPLNVDSNWDILVRAENSAKSVNCHNAPMIAAAREYNSGKIAVINMDPRFCIADGYHRAYGGYVMEKGDLRRLLKNIYYWMGGPVSNNSVVPSAKETRHLITIATEKNSRQNANSNLNTYKGLVALIKDPCERSVNEYIQAARHRKLDYIVLCPDYNSLDESGWLGFTQLCKKSSEADMQVIPGLHYVMGGMQTPLVVINPKRFLTKKETDYPQNTNIVIFNLDWPGTIINTPGKNLFSPWQHKFYTGLSLLSYQDDNLIDNAIDEYRDLVASDYRLIPVSCVSFSSAHALSSFEGACTMVQAGGRDMIAEGLKAVFGSGNSYVSTGPVIKDFCVSYGNQVIASGGGLTLPAGSPIQIAFEIISNANLDKVALYEGSKCIAQWLVRDTNDFRYSVDKVQSQNTCFTLHVVDQDGNIAISNGIRIQNPRLNYTMCIDKQNSIINFTEPESQKTGVILNCWIAGNDIGMCMAAAPPIEIAPALEDVTWATVSAFECTPKITGYCSEGDERAAIMNNIINHGPTPLVKRQCRISTEDFAVFESVLDNSCFKGKTIETIVRPSMYGPYLVLVEGEYEVKKTPDTTDPQSGDVTILRLMTNNAAKTYEKFALCDSNGVEYSGEFPNSFEGSSQFKAVYKSSGLGQGQGLVLFPSKAGNFGIITLQDGYNLSCGLTRSKTNALVFGANEFRNYIDAGIGGAKNLRPGQVISQKFLFLHDGGKTDYPDAFVAFLKTFKKTSSTFIAEHGKVQDNSFPVEIECEGGFSKLEVLPGACSLPNYVLRAKGVNVNWDAVVYDHENGSLKHLAQYDGNAMALIRSDRYQKIFVGNPITSDRADLGIGLIEFKKDRIKFTVNNLTGKQAEAVLRFPICGNPDIAEKIVMGPGEFRLFEMCLPE